MTRIHFDPLLPDIWFAAVIGAALVLFMLALFKNKKGLILRSITFAAFILTLLNPSLLEEQRKPSKDVAVILVDQSPSQKMGLRDERTAQALEYLKGELDNKKDLELRIVKAPIDGVLASETNLFDALEKNLADIPLQRRAGVIVLSDGQIHDIPTNPDRYEQYGPVHLLLSGEKNEKDRQLVITEAPAYGIVGQSITVQYKIEDTPNIREKSALVTLSRPDTAPEYFTAPVNQDLTIDVPVDHAGQNIFELSVDPVSREITESNNKTAILVNGVRDRLKVLLVSGKPHAGGRAWRDLLTSDPGVDLVHFTILREPEKLDATPQNELALIEFPFRELFEVKLYDFDLIIFDRYRLNHILPEAYFDNIVRYVEKGGALLEASGPAFASEDSLYTTALKNVIPGAPTGAITDKAFKPKVTELGHKHPVTQNLSGEWGSWLRHIVINNSDGDVLMSGADDLPLLLLNRFDDGRVAQIASDHLWLWSRGYEGGGPHAELLRRVVHWLMKEPELDEKALNISVSDNTITIESRNTALENSDITMTRPDGSTDTLKLETAADNTLRTKVMAEQLGIYSFEDAENQKRFAIIGELNPPELRSVRSTAEPLKPFIEASQGGALWLSDHATPGLRLLSNARHYAGRNWIGLRENNDYTVQAVTKQTLIPQWLAALILLSLVILSWWRESRA